MTTFYTYRFYARTAGNPYHELTLDFLVKPTPDQIRQAVAESNLTWKGKDLLTPVLLCHLEKDFHSCTRVIVNN